MKTEILNKLLEKTANALGIDKAELNENTKIKSINLKSL